MRGVAYAFGLAVGAATVAGANVVVRGSAVPVLFAFLVALLLAHRPWVTPGWVLTLGIGTTAAWFGGQGDEATYVFASDYSRVVLYSLVGLTVFAAGHFLIQARFATGPAARSSRWLLALLVASLLVAFFSGNAGGPSPMRHRFEFWGLTPEQAELLVLLVRKIIHVVFYATVGNLATRAAFAGGEVPSRGRWIGLGFALLLASFDELRQSGSAERSGQAIDVALDMFGASMGMLLVKATSNRSAKR